MALWNEDQKGDNSFVQKFMLSSKFSFTNITNILTAILRTVISCVQIPVHKRSLKFFTNKIFEELFDCFNSKIPDRWCMYKQTTTDRLHVSPLFYQILQEENTKKTRCLLVSCKENSIVINFCSPPLNTQQVQGIKLYKLTLSLPSGRSRYR